jgi:L-lactate permease
VGLCPKYLTLLKGSVYNVLIDNILTAFPFSTKATDLIGKEGLIVRRTIVHSLILVDALGVIVMIQQYLIPGIIP